MKLSDDLKSLIGTVAPTLGTALGGPLGGAAGLFIANALGVKPGDDAAAAKALGTADPATLLALKKADNDFKTHLADLGVQESQLAYADTDSARKREIAVKDGTPAQLAWLVIGGFLALSAAQVWAVMGYADQVAKIPAQGWLLIGNVSGYLAAEAKQAAAYYFGSSAGSQAKDQLLYNSTPVDK